MTAIQHTAFKTTPFGPIAKIDGVWYSVNGTVSEIVDVRFKLSEHQRVASGVQDDGVETHHQQVMYKEQELQLINTAITALNNIARHGHNTGTVECVVDDMMTSVPVLQDRALKIKDWLKTIRDEYNA